MAMTAKEIMKMMGDDSSNESNLEKASNEIYNSKVASKAIQNGDIDKLKSCLEKGIDVDAGKSPRGDSAITEAVKSNNLDIVKVLAEHGIDINGRKFDNPLETAIKLGYIDIIKYLIEKGARFDKNKQNHYGLTYLHDAVFENNYDLVKLFLDNDVDINIKSNIGRTSLDIAIEYNCDEKIISLLKQNGAKENLKITENSNTQLEADVFTNYSDFIELYIDLATNIKRNGKAKAFYTAQESTEKEISYIVKFVKYKDNYPDKLESFIKENYDNSRFRDILLQLNKFEDDISIGHLKMYIYTILVEDNEKYIEDLNNWFDNQDKYLNDIKYAKELLAIAKKDGIMTIESDVYNSDMDSIIKELLNLRIDYTPKEMIEELYKIKLQHTLWIVKKYCHDEQNCSQEIENKMISLSKDYFKYLDELIEFI